MANNNKRTPNTWAWSKSALKSVVLHPHSNTILGSEIEPCTPQVQYICYTVINAPVEVELEPAKACAVISDWAGPFEACFCCIWTDKRPDGRLNGNQKRNRKEEEEEPKFQPTPKRTGTIDALLLHRSLNVMVRYAASSRHNRFAFTFYRRDISSDTIGKHPPDEMRLIKLRHFNWAELFSEMIFDFTCVAMNETSIFFFWRFRRMDNIHSHNPPAYPMRSVCLCVHCSLDRFKYGNFHLMNRNLFKSWDKLVNISSV